MPEPIKELAKLRGVIVFFSSYVFLKPPEKKCFRTAHNRFLIPLFRTYFEKLKSVYPKISRIGRQKRKNNFFSYLAKRTHLVTYFREWHQRGSISSSFLRKFAKLENSATGPSAATMRLEIWHMFNTLVWTYQTLSKHDFPLHSLWGFS